MKVLWSGGYLLTFVYAVLLHNPHTLLATKPKSDGPIICSSSLLDWVESGKIPLAFARAIQALLNEGPERWVVVEGSQTEGFFFQLGLSGGLGSDQGIGNRHLKSGAEYALPILSGEGNPIEGHVSILQSVKEAEEYLGQVNRQYAFPLVLNGSAAPFKLNQATEASNNSSKVIPARGLVPSNIHAMGLFFHNDDKNRDEFNYYWASNYIALMNSLQEQGIVAGPKSRGAKFLSELKNVWDQREWHYRPYKESFGLNELANPNTVFTALEMLFKKYRK